jgi:DegV family protein with EDD domain
MKVICDSALQLEPPRVKELNLQVVEYPIFLNGEPYPHSMTMSREEKDKLRLLLKDKNNKVTTTGLKAQDLLETYQKYPEEKIISIHQAGKASTATYQTLRQLRMDHPDVDVEFVDAHHLTAAYSVIVLQVAEAVNRGMNYEDLMEYIKLLRKNTRHLGCVYDLFYLHRTGRIGLAKALMGSAMKIIALLSSSDDPGVLKSIGKVKNGLQANTRFIQILKEEMVQKQGTRGKAVISIIGPHEKEAMDLKKKLDDLDFPVDSEIHYTNHSNMPHAGPDFYDIGYTIHGQ